jgi:hypothetical protein
MPKPEKAHQEKSKTETKSSMSRGEKKSVGW